MIKRVILSLLVSTFCLAGIYPNQSPKTDSKEEVVKSEADTLKDQALLARKLLLKFAQNSVDLINEQQSVFNSLVTIHDSTMTSANKFSLKKQFTKKEWQTASHIKELEKQHDDFLKKLAISSDFLVFDSINEQELKKQICSFAEKVFEFCNDVTIKSFKFSDQENINVMLSEIESSISRIEKKVKQIQDDPTFIGRMKKALWGSNFSYNILPSCITASLYISKFIVTKNRAQKAIRFGDMDAANTLRDSKLEAAAKFGVTLAKDDLIVFLGQFITETFKSAQRIKYDEREYKKKQTLRIKDQRIQKILGEKIRFDDIVGYEDVKKHLKCVVESLVNPLKFKRFGVDVPKGLLLAGAPGTGKTLFARAIAGESGCPCFVINPSDLVGQNMYGNANTKIDDLFEQAEACAPSIIFIDELDFIGSRKNKEIEKSTALANLLTKLNGFKARNPYRPVLIIAATNCPEDLDEALIRSGRFDIKIDLELPDASERETLITKELKARTFGNATDLKVEDIVKLTDGYSSADIINIINKTFLKTAFQGTDFPTVNTFADAIQEVNYNTAVAAA